MGASPLFTTGATYLAGAGAAGGAGAGALGALGAAAGPLGIVAGLAPLLIHPKRNGMKLMNGLGNIGSRFMDGLLDTDNPYHSAFPFFNQMTNPSQQNATQNQQRQNQQRQNNSNAPYDIAGNGWGSSMIPVSGLSPSMPRPAVPFYESKLLPAPFKQKVGLAALQQLNNEMIY